jgi:REP element-mobilizing transposase RayT
MILIIRRSSIPSPKRIGSGEIEVLAYSLTGNHYHLCLRTPKGNLTRVMRHVDGLYTQRFNRRHGRDGTLFRDRYKAILIEADEYLAAVVRYIHLNAVGAGIVKMPEEYRWASHRYYYQAKGVPIGLIPKRRWNRSGEDRPFMNLCYQVMKNL